MMDVTRPTPRGRAHPARGPRAAAAQPLPRRWLERPWPPAWVFEVVSTVLALGITTIVMMSVVHFNPLNPAADLILENNTPTGGDMGAHVWGPAFLRDHLLPNFQLNGWSMDWYAGMPTYRFYMVTPALAIVASTSSCRTAWPSSSSPSPG